METVADIAKKEVTKQTIELVFMVAGVALVALVHRHVSDPDNWRTLKARTTLWVADFAFKQQRIWRRIENDARTVYRDMLEW